MCWVLEAIKMLTKKDSTAMPFFAMFAVYINKFLESNKIFHIKSAVKNSADSTNIFRLYALGPGEG